MAPRNDVNRTRGAEGDRRDVHGQHESARAPSREFVQMQLLVENLRLYTKWMAKHGTWKGFLRCQTQRRQDEDTG